MRFIHLCCFMFLSIVTCFSQGYVIDAYHVDVNIGSDGQVLVEEQIEIDFEEERRGIIREIPLNYKDASAQSGSAIIVDEINVVDDPFLVMREGSLVKIRIGSPNIKLRGKKKYQINYRVLGAVEQFGDHAEFPWNIIGNQWDTRIKSATARITMPYDIQDTEKDVLLNIRNRAYSLKDIEYSLDKRVLSMKFPGSLKSRQGVSVALRFTEHKFPIQHVPSIVLSDQFYVNNVNIDLTISANGEVSAKEQYHITSKSLNPSFNRVIDVVSQQSERWNTVYRKPDIVSATWNGLPMHVTGSRSADSYMYEINSAKLAQGKQGYLEFNYVMHGALAENDRTMAALLDLGSFDGQVALDTINIRYNLPAGVQLAGKIGVKGFISTKIRENEYQFVRKSFTSGPIRQRIELKGFNSMRLIYPKESLYDRQLVESLSLDVLIENDGLTVNQLILLKNRSANEGVKYYLGKAIDTKSFPYEVRSDNLLSRSMHAIINSEELHPDYQLKQAGKYNLASTINSDVESRFYSTYSLPMIKSKNGLIIPIYHPSNAPIDHVQLIIRDESGKQVLDLEENGYFLGTEKKEIDIFTHEGYQYVYVPMDMSTLASGPGIAKFMKSIRANWRLAAAIVISTFLYMLWYLFGRDKKYDGTAYAHPPDYMTPAEAGYLWDGKLHGRDLISLIYHWAAKDLIVIEEVGNADDSTEYYLERLKDLPNQAFEYERILFNKIFDNNGDRVRVSSLRNSLYSTMEKANKALKAAFEKKHLYEPLTRGVGTLFVIIGFLLFTVGLVLLGVGAGAGDYSWSLPILTVGMASIFFGYYLPKKTALGSQYFIALQKFNKFIDDAPVEELESLYSTDSNYFQNTLAYAIVLGKAKKWAKRFSGLMTAPPSYYRGTHYDNFSPVYFTDRVITGMHSMEKDFYSTPAPSASTSTYSGGRSSSFGGGGFSSGGGFGGGGGSSW